MILHSMDTISSDSYSNTYVLTCRGGGASIVLHYYLNGSESFLNMYRSILVFICSQASSRMGSWYWRRAASAHSMIWGSHEYVDPSAVAPLIFGFFT